MKAAIAVNNLGFIGKGDGMLWHCRDDFKHFKALTTLTVEEGRLNTMLVGGTTFKGMPILKDRTLIVVSRTLEHIGNTLENALASNPDWCIGGKSIYEQTCHLWTELHISHINNNSIGDVVFPDLSNLNPECKIFNYSFTECI